MAEHTSGVAIGASGAPDPVARHLFDSSNPLEVGSRALFLWGASVERTIGFVHHPLGERWPGGEILGHLFGDSLPIDNASRALFLLGVAAERAHRPLEDVLERLGDDRWAMSAADKALVLLVAAARRPRRAIDAGTYLGGSATALAGWCDHVTTIDLDPARAATVAELPNVAFRAGTAHEVLAELLAEDPEVELVLLDEDHGEAGVAAEVAAVLAAPGPGLRTVLVHDVAMPSCRRGLDGVDWSGQPAVRGVTIDFLPGELTSDGPVGGMALLWTMGRDPDLR